MAESSTSPKEGRHDRSGLKSLVLFVQPDKVKQLKMLALEEDRTLQSVGDEMIDFFLAHRDKATPAKSNAVREAPKTKVRSLSSEEKKRSVKH